MAEGIEGFIEWLTQVTGLSPWQLTTLAFLLSFFVCIGLFVHYLRKPDSPLEGENVSLLLVDLTKEVRNLVTELRQPKEAPPPNKAPVYNRPKNPYNSFVQNGLEEEEGSPHTQVGEEVTVEEEEDVDERPGISKEVLDEFHRSRERAGRV